MSDLNCVFRIPITNTDAAESEFSHCGWLQKVTGADASSCIVPNSACKACIASSQVDPIGWNRVLPSIAFGACDQLLQQTPLPKSVDQIRNLCERAEYEILQQAGRWIPDRLPACDLLLICRNDDDISRQAIQSVLDQADAFVVLHLVVSAELQSFANEFANEWNVRIHQLPNAASFTDTAHALIEAFETPFLAFQSDRSTSHPRRIADAISRLDQEGAELFLSARTNACGRIEPSNANQSNGQRHTSGGKNEPIETLVMRRALFVDLEGSCGSDLAFVERAAMQERPIVRSASVLVEQMAADHFVSNQANTDRKPRGFCQQKVDCDVVLPFYGEMEFVSKAIESVLNQENANVVIHLIDDASLNDTSTFLHRWKTHRPIRVYRNRQNIGQFASFNQVSRFFETDLVAVQDADDISLPHRVTTAGNLLRLSGTEFFGAAVKLFGDQQAVEPSGPDQQRTVGNTRPDFRHSSYPKFRRVHYFIENPTAVFKTEMFRRMGGYADFGDRLTNRASLDTEFLMRCLYSEVRFAISRNVVTKYRVHADSATQNEITGWGSDARKRSSMLVAQRTQAFQSHRFDPRLYGALARVSPELTERI